MPGLGPTVLTTNLFPLDSHETAWNGKITFLQTVHQSNMYVGKYVLDFTS
jgi:hypothetical protein